MTATITNENKAGTGINVGSANLTPPANFTVTPGSSSVTGVAPFVCPSSCTATVVGNVVQLRRLAVPPGSSVLLRMLVSTPPQASPPGAFICTVASPCAWSVLAKQSNDFSGPPGNNLNVDPATSATNTVLGQLRFSAEPHSEMLQDPLNTTCGNLVGCPDFITDMDYTPSGGPVTVSVVDATGTVVTAYAGTVDLTLNAPAFPPNTRATLEGTTSTSTSGGVASFGNLVVTLAGNQYTINASTQDMPPLSTTSTGFNVQQAGTQCTTKTACKTETKSTNFATTSGGVDATVAATFGQATDLAESLDFGSHLPVGTLSPPQDCEGYDALHDVYWNFISSTGSTTISIATTVLSGTISGSLINGQDSCLGAPKPFYELDESTKPESLRLLTTATQLPDGTSLFIGLLPDCGSKKNQIVQGTGPCVLSRTGTSNTLGGGTLTITSSVPASFGDFVNRG